MLHIDSRREGHVWTLGYVPVDDAQSWMSILQNIYNTSSTKLLRRSSCCSWFVHFCMTLMSMMSLWHVETKQTEGCDLDGSTWGDGYRRYRTWRLEHQRTLAAFVGWSRSSPVEVIHSHFFFAWFFHSFLMLGVDCSQNLRTASPCIFTTRRKKAQRDRPHWWLTIGTPWFFGLATYHRKPLENHKKPININKHDFDRKYA